MNFLRRRSIESSVPQKAPFSTNLWLDERVYQRAVIIRRNKVHPDAAFHIIVLCSILYCPLILLKSTVE